MSTEDKKYEWHEENCPTCRTRVLEMVDEAGTPTYRRIGEVDTPDRMTVKEFRELGYLQELNRRFLHPLGLAMEIVIEEDGTERLGTIWDAREDPEGFIFGPGVIDQEKVKYVAEKEMEFFDGRMRRFGFIIQKE